MEFRGRLLPDDVRGAESEMAPRRGDGTGRRGDRRLRRHRGARAPRALVPGDLARGCGRRRSETEVLPVRPDEVRWHSRANLADGYTGDLGYEIWVERERAEALWDTVMKLGQGHDITPAGMLALDIARIEAGLILAEVEYMPSRKAVIDAQMYSPLELSLDWTLAANKGPFIGRKALLEEQRRGPSRRTVGLEIDWQTVERFYWDMGLPPQPPAEPWREKVPLYSGYRQIGWATSGCWSPLLKRYIAIATVASPYSRPGTRVEIEVAVEWERHRAPATVVERPFFEPARKKA